LDTFADDVLAVDRGGDDAIDTSADGASETPSHRHVSVFALRLDLTGSLGVPALLVLCDYAA